MDIVDVTVETFEGREGDLFAVRFKDGSYDLTVAAVERTPGEWGRSDMREPFSVTFHGEPTHVLPQGVWTLTHDELGDIQLFLVPLGPVDGGAAQQYQAVFA